MICNLERLGVEAMDRIDHTVTSTVIIIIIYSTFI